MTSNEVRQAPISRRRTLSVLVVALVSTLATAQQPELPPATRTRLEGAISRFMSASGIPGLSVAVVLSGQHVWSKGFGFADLENNVPVTSQTLFRLASVSKPITATYPAPHPFLFQVKIGQYRQPDFLDSSYKIPGRRHYGRARRCRARRRSAGNEHLYHACPPATCRGGGSDQS